MTIAELNPLDIPYIACSTSTVVVFVDVIRLLDFFEHSPTDKFKAQIAVYGSTEPPKSASELSNR